MFTLYRNTMFSYLIGNEVEVMQGTLYECLAKAADFEVKGFTTFIRQGDY